jgi:aspartate aminotransferase
MGPAHIISRMKSILSHVGAWSPMPEQMATSRYLQQKGSVDQFLRQLRKGIHERLDKIHKGFQQLKKDGHPVDSMAPQASIYLTVKVDLKGKRASDGRVLETQADVTRYLLEHAGLALVPFHVFGMDRSTPWYRLSVGTVRVEEVQDMLKGLKQALTTLE